MKDFVVVRTQFFMWAEEKSIYGRVIQAENFEKAVNILKKEDSIDIFGNSLCENITAEDIENEVFSFKNDRSRYKGDSFDLRELDKLDDDLN